MDLHKIKISVTEGTAMAPWNGSNNGDIQFADQKNIIIDSNILKIQPHVPK